MLARELELEQNGKSTIHAAKAIRLALSLALVGCSRVIHPAAVSPGLTVDVLPGITRTHHSPAPHAQQEGLRRFDAFDSSTFVAEIALSYGWEIDEQRGAQLGVSAGVNVSPTVDLYFQLRRSPVDAGIGLTLSTNGRLLPDGLVPGIYAMVGKGWPLSVNHKLRLDLGYRLEALHSVPNDPGSSWARVQDPFALLSVNVTHAAAVGLWADSRWYSAAVITTWCDENCAAADLASLSVAGGVFIRGSL